MYDRLSNMVMKYSTGAEKSKIDLRTYSYKPTKSSQKGGERYATKFIDDQHKVGICTSISLTMNAHKATGKKYSPDFQYLIQKKFTDGNWDEGSSIFSAIKTANKFGMLPEKYWKFTTIEDRKKSYRTWIKKLQKITDKEIEDLLDKCEKVIQGYAKVPVSPEYLKNAIDDSTSGLLVRFAIGEEWWKNPIEPLRPAKEFISGHAVSSTNYDGGSFRIANSWGTDWADKGTAYHLYNQYKPTEAYSVFYKEIPKEVDKKPLTNTTIEQVLRLIEILKKLGLIT